MPLLRLCGWSRHARACSLLLCLLAGGAWAQSTYPTKAIRFIAPFPPGGSSDVLCRLLAQRLTDTLGQPVMVENRPGAGANIGHELAARSAPDGYTLLLSNSSAMTTNPHLYKRLGFDPVSDFAPVSMVATAGQVLVVNPRVPVGSVAELIALAKARPGELNYASSGNGSGQHLFMAQFASQAGLQLVHVPYRGSGQATTDLLAGTVPMAMPGTAGMVAHIKAGKLRPLATSGVTRSPQLPDVPTLAESGLAGYSAYVWLGLLAPKGTPAAIIERLHRELKASLAAPELRAYFTEAGIEIVGSTPAEMDAFFRDERDHWARVVKDSGAKID